MASIMYLLTTPESSPMPLEITPHSTYMATAFFRRALKLQIHFQSRQISFTEPSFAFFRRVWTHSDLTFIAPFSGSSDPHAFLNFSIAIHRQFMV